MRAERPRAARYPFIASVTLTELESGSQTIEKTRDLSLFGCHVVPGKALTTGMRIRLQITRNGEVFEALARVANVRPTTGIGIAFTNIEEPHQLVLEKWLAELRRTRG